MLYNLPTPETEEAEPFDWHKYLTISSKFSVTQAGLLSQTLDQIVAAKNEEGIALIKYAGLQQGGNITIILGEHNYLDETKHELAFSFEDASHVVYTEAGILRRPSLNGILVHELVHAADNFPTAKEFNQIADIEFPDMLRRQGISPREIASARKDLLEIASSVSPSHALSLLVQDDFSRYVEVIKLRSTGFHNLSAVMDKTSASEAIIMLKKVGEIDVAGTSIRENRAVAYTDYFMSDNYGTAEPQRLSFTNASFSSEPIMPKVLISGSDAHTSQISPAYRHNDPEVPKHNISPAKEVPLGGIRNVDPCILGLLSPSKMPSACTTATPLSK